MKKRTVAALLLATAMLVSGCGTSKKQSVKLSESDFESYPFKQTLELSCWRQLDTNLSATYSNQSESPYEQELMKRTNVKVNYQHPAAGSVQEAFNIMISSGDLPDLIYYPWEWYQGGSVKAIADGHLEVITDKMEKYAPAYTAFLKANEDVDRAVRTENGDYFGFPTVKNDRILLTSAGLMMRKDYLDELGLPVPETMDEIYTALKAMKEQKGVKLPYSGDLYNAALWGIFTSAYGVLPELYVDGDKVLFGAAQPGFKEYLTTMNKWYKEGLIDNSFATLDSKTIDSNIINGFSAMTNAAGGGGMGVYLKTATEKNPSYDLVGLKTPVINKGDTPMSGHYSPKISGHYMAITTACENVEAAMKYLDYHYTDEGHMFANFGVEGVSYEMVNGQPVYTDFIMNNEEGKNVSHMMAQYILASSVGGAYIQDERYITQYYKLNQQKDALMKWSDNDAEKHAMPMLHIDDAKLSKISPMLTDLQTYTQEMTAKFIMGTEPLSNYEKFVSDLEKMGLKEVEAAYTEALDRYYKK